MKLNGKLIAGFLAIKIILMFSEFLLWRFWNSQKEKAEGEEDKKEDYVEANEDPNIKSEANMQIKEPAIVTVVKNQEVNEISKVEDKEILSEVNTSSKVGVEVEVEVEFKNKKNRNESKTHMIETKIEENVEIKVSFNLLNIRKWK